MKHSLPVNDVLDDIKTALLKHNQLILQAPPGAGKTTLVPIALLDQAWLGEKMIIMLEPRRLAARAAAERMASLLGEKVGERVGYQIKMERRFSDRTKILVVTEGILTRKLQADPALENTALIIFDEFHERSLHADLSLALSLQSQEVIRDDLKILIMSATLNASAISTLLGDAPVITSEGKSYAVEQIYLDHKTATPDRKTLTLKMSAVIEEALKHDEGSILAFLPGVKEIIMLQNRLIDMLRQKGIRNVIVAPLYGALGKEEQRRAISPTKDGERKIVLSTNIAETSLTIEGIRIVIDSGLQRVSTYHTGSGMNRLETIFISQDSAIQRSGRAGRLSDGKCYRLWHAHKSLVKHQKPEILTSDLTQMMLELAQWGVNDPSELIWLDPPAAEAVKHARELLGELMMTDKRDVITDHGKEALSLGLHPRFGHMILKAEVLEGTYEACLLAALLSERDIVKPSAGFASDLRLRLSLLFEKHLDHPSINSAEARRVVEQADLLYQKVPKLQKIKQKIKQHQPENLGVLLGFAYPDRIAKARNLKDRRYLLSNGKGAILDFEDDLITEEYLAVADLNVQEKDARIFLAAPLTLDQIEHYFSELIQKESVLMWNSNLKRVEASVKTTFLKLTLREQQSNDVTQDAIARKLIEGIRQEGLEVLPWSKESLALKQRVNFLNIQKMEHEKLLTCIDLPDFSDEMLLQTMESWLLPYVEGISDLRGCRKLNLEKILFNAIEWQQRQFLDEFAPRTLSVPSGSKIAIDYTDPKNPILPVRLQELFGLENTPTLLKGEHKLLLHLLSPAYRPMQVTYDLKSFWSEAYHEVKKELRGKYKKHYWPDDPLTAQATNRTKKNMINRES